MSTGEAFLELIQTMNPYTTPAADKAKDGKATGREMHFGHLQAPTGSKEPTASKEPAGSKKATDSFQVEIDNYKGEWTFRGGTEQIKRSLRITYRYEILVKDLEGHERGTGLYATEHLLIGYTGGNGP